MDQGKYTAVEMDEKKSDTDSQRSIEGPFDHFGENFWEEVQKRFESKGISWSEAMDEVRIERLMNKPGADGLLVMIRDWPKDDKFKGRSDLLKGLEKIISRFTKIILDKDTIEKYKGFRDEQDETAQPTLLHLAAKQNFVHVAKYLVKKYPGLVYLKTNDDEERLPVEKALDEKHDETAAFLISQMKQDRVHELFKYNMNLGKAKYSLSDYISKKDPGTNEPHMKKTVMAVLNSLINPRWPYMETQKGDENLEKAWSSVPDDPLHYDFFYHLLEGDDKGMEPKINEEKNKAFNAESKSCLRHLTESRYKEAIQHPVIRSFVKRKWEKFAFTWFRRLTILYVIFLAVLSYALIYGATRDDPWKYTGGADYFRGICEVLTIIFLTLQISEEIFQIRREYDVYYKGFYNYCDWGGLIFTFLVIPLRFANSSSQWGVASLGYIFNFLRIFKFSCVSRATGLYTKTLEKIICRDVTRFIALFVVVCIGFCGALFMVLTATGKQDTFSNYGDLMLAAVRVLTGQQQVVEGDYTKFNLFAILVLLVYTGLVIVVLLNVLIAQLSSTYSEAKNNAKLQYSIDRMSIIARIEQWPFFNFRVNYYKEGEGQVSETALINEMLEYSEERSPWETTEEKLKKFRDMMRKLIGKEADKTDEDNFRAQPKVRDAEVQANPERRDAEVQANPERRDAEVQTNPTGVKPQPEVRKIRDAEVQTTEVEK